MSEKNVSVIKVRECCRDKCQIYIDFKGILRWHHIHFPFSTLLATLPLHTPSVPFLLTSVPLQPIHTVVWRSGTSIPSTPPSFSYTSSFFVWHSPLRLMWHYVSNAPHCPPSLALFRLCVFLRHSPLRLTWHYVTLALHCVPRLCVSLRHSPLRLVWHYTSLAQHCPIYPAWHSPLGTLPFILCGTMLLMPHTAPYVPIGTSRLCVSLRHSPLRLAWHYVSLAPQCLPVAGTLPAG